MDDDQRIITRGTHGEFHWLTVGGDVYMGTFLTLVPEAVLGRYLAVTSLDSGVPREFPELLPGWKLRGDVVYSPIVESVGSLLYQRDGPESPGYDEWYVFATPHDLGQVFHGNYFEFQPGRGETLVFVNTFAFVLHKPGVLPEILDRFWNQLEIIDPESYIADGRDYLTFVSKRKELVDRLNERLEGLA